MPLPDQTQAQPPQGPPPQWRVAQHRVRNDLQTLNALLRLARRRAPAATLLDDIGPWLSAVAAVYDALPLWDEAEWVSLRGLAGAVRLRCGLPAPVEFTGTDEPRLPAASAVAGAVALLGLFSFCCRGAARGATVTLEISDDAAGIRVEAMFRPAGSLPEWPPLGLAIAADALGAEYAMGEEDEGVVAILVLPASPETGRPL